MRTPLLVAGLLTLTVPAFGQSSAAFPDTPARASAVPSPAPAPRPPVERTTAPDAASAAASARDGSSEPGFAPRMPPPAPAYYPSAAGPYAAAQPTFAPAFAPSSPMRDGGEGATSAGASSTLLVVGAILVGLPYATGLGIGASEGFDNGSAWLAAPAIGPWLALSGRRDPCADSQQKKEFDSDVGKCVAEPMVRGMLVLDGVLQATGAVMMLVGASSGGTPKPRREARAVVAAPTPMGRDGYGLAVAGAF